MGLSLVSQLLLILLSVLALTRAQMTTAAATIQTIESTATSTTTTTILPETTTIVLPETTTTETTTIPETTTTESTTESTTTAQPETTTTTTTVLPATPTTTAWTVPAIFYPFGLAAGDGKQLENGGETSVKLTFSTPFTFFGRKYNYIYVNNNGLLTFNQPLPEAQPSIIPTHGADDFIAALWTELDDIGIGKYWYQQYTSGSVLTRASQDINQYFPHIGFTASWVFVATWDYVQTQDMNTITFQVVLISGGGFSFILMNYGDFAATHFAVEAGYDTINSTDYHVIHYDLYGDVSNLKNMTNVNVPGRWAFLVNSGTENILGVQMKLSSFLDLTQNENIEDVLQQIKHVLVQNNVSSFFEMKLRNIKKTHP